MTSPETRCLRYVIRSWFWRRFHTTVERIVSCPLSRLVDCGIEGF